MSVLANEMENSLTYLKPNFKKNIHKHKLNINFKLNYLFYRFQEKKNPDRDYQLREINAQF